MIVHSLTDESSTHNHHPGSPDGTHSSAGGSDDDDDSAAPAGVMAALLTSIPFAVAAAATLIIAHTSKVSPWTVLIVSAVNAYCPLTHQRHRRYTAAALQTTSYI